MKKQTLKAYTLVELVVVIAIIGILATVAVPNLIGQVGKSKYNSAQKQAEAIFNAAQTVAQKYEATDRAITDDKKKLLFGSPSDKILIFGNLSFVTNDTSDEYQKEAGRFVEKLSALNSHLDDGKWAIVIENYKVTHVVYSDSETDKYVGVYCDCENKNPATNHHVNTGYDSYDKSSNILAKWTDITSAIPIT